MAKKAKKKPNNDFNEGTNKLIKGIKKYFKILVTLLIGYIALQYVSFKYYPILFSAYSIYPYWKEDGSVFWTNVVAFHKEDCNPKKPFIIDTLKSTLSDIDKEKLKKGNFDLNPVYKEILYSNLDTYKHLNNGVYVLRKFIYIIFGTLQIFLNYFCGLAFFVCSIIYLVFYPICKGFSFLSGSLRSFMFNNYSYKINLNAIYELIPADDRDAIFKFPLESILSEQTFEPNMNLFPTIASYLTSIGNFGVDNLLYKNTYFKRNAFRYEFKCPKKGDKVLHRKGFIGGWINMGIDFLLGIGIVWLLHHSIAKGFTYEGGPNVKSSTHFGFIFIFIILFFMVFGLNAHFLPTLFKPFTNKYECDNKESLSKDLTDMQIADLLKKGEIKYINDVVIRYLKNPVGSGLKGLM